MTTQAENLSRKESFHRIFGNSLHTHTKTNRKEKHLNLSLLSDIIKANIRPCSGDYLYIRHASTHESESK